MNAFTADKARDLARSKDPGAAVLDILKHVKEAAEAGKYTVDIRSHGFGDGWAYGGETPAYNRAIMDELKKLGYAVNVGSECRQFVDVWLIVSWEAK